MITLRILTGLAILIAIVIIPYVLGIIVFKITKETKDDIGDIYMAGLLTSLVLLLIIGLSHEIGRVILN